MADCILDHAVFRLYDNHVSIPSISSRSRLVTLLLSLLIFCGFCGIHRMYAGRWVTGIIQLVTGGLLGIWQVIDIVRILCGYFTDDEGLPIIR